MKELPDNCPNPSTSLRRLKELYEAEVLKDIWRAFVSESDANGAPDWESEIMNF